VRVGIGRGGRDSGEEIASKFSSASLAALFYKSYVFYQTKLAQSQAFSLLKVKDNELRRFSKEMDIDLIVLGGNYLCDCHLWVYKN
jgi:hypothetical protein